MMDRVTLGDRHYQVAQTVREHLARYRELEDIIAMLGLEALSEADRRTVLRARLLERYLTQPFFVVAEHTGIAGASVPLETTLGDCEDFIARQLRRPAGRSLLHARQAWRACDEQRHHPASAQCRALRAHRQAWRALSAAMPAAASAFSRDEPAS